MKLKTTQNCGREKSIHLELKASKIQLAKKLVPPVQMKLQSSATFAADHLNFDNYDS